MPGFITVQACLWNLHASTTLLHNQFCLCRQKLVITLETR